MPAGKSFFDAFAARTNFPLSDGGGSADSGGGGDVDSGNGGDGDGGEWGNEFRRRKSFEEERSKL